jgi:hypothetical protein
MDPIRCDTLKVKQGDTFKRTVSIQQDGVLLDLTGYTFLAQLRTYAGAAAPAAADIEVLDGNDASHKILRLTNLVTAGLAARVYWIELQWTTPGGDVATLLEGDFTVTAQGTQ